MNQYDFGMPLAAGKVTTGLASEWPCISDLALHSYGLKAYEGMNASPICAAARNVVRFTFLVDRLERLPLPALCVI